MSDEIGSIKADVNLTLNYHTDWLAEHERRLRALEGQGKERQPAEGPLKRCPFCGSNARLREHPAGFEIVCTCCGTYVGSFPEEKRARQFWNKRWEKGG